MARAMSRDWLEETVEQLWRDPLHPGTLVRSLCMAGLSVGQAARKLGVDRDELAALVECRGRVTPALALRMEAAGWSTANLWMRKQAAYDLARERLRQGAV